MLNIITKPSNPYFTNGRIGEVLNVYTKEKNLDYVELESTKEGYEIYKNMELGLLLY